MKIKLDLIRPKQILAFAAYLTAVAADREEYNAELKAERAKRIGSRYVSEAEQPAEAPDAPFIEPSTTQENSSVATPPEKKTRQRKSKDTSAVSIPSIDNAQTDIETAIAEQAAISTGEERVGPEDSPEVVAQDAADEAAETAATKTALTLDDVRNALGEYVKLYGMEVTHLDGPKVISMVCGEGKAKVSDIPDDKIAEVVAGVREMTVKNPFGRAKVAA